MENDDFYDNLLRATNNVADITTEKFATIVKLEELYCSAKEEETGLEHSNVPILNGLSLDLGDKVVLGFAENSIYNPCILGKVGLADLDSAQVVEKSALANLGLPAGSTQHAIKLKVDEKINQGGGGGGIVMVGSFRINEEGHLIATIPNGASNPYRISNGHLIYNTEAE